MKTNTINNSRISVKRKLLSILILVCSFLCLLFLGSGNEHKTYADSGPKPGMNVNIYNLPNRNFVIGFLYNHERSTMHSGKSIIDLGYIDEGIENEYHYLYLEKETSGLKNIEIKWSYNCPKNVKIMIYDIDNNICYISKLFDRQLFQENVDVNFNKLNVDNLTFPIERTAAIFKIIGGFLLRCILTIGLELLVALTFKLNKKSIKLVVIVNIITQALLNAGCCLFVIVFNKLIFFLYGIVFLFIVEIVVWLIESLFYRKRLIKKDNEKKVNGFLFSLIANFVSLTIGFLLWLF